MGKSRTEQAGANQTRQALETASRQGLFAFVDMSHLRKLATLGDLTWRQVCDSWNWTTATHAAVRAASYESLSTELRKRFGTPDLSEVQDVNRTIRFFTREYTITLQQVVNTPHLSVQPRQATPDEEAPVQQMTLGL